MVFYLDNYFEIEFENLSIIVELGSFRTEREEIIKRRLNYTRKEMKNIDYNFFIRRFVFEKNEFQTHHTRIPNQFLTTHVRTFLSWFLHLFDEVHYCIK